MTAPSDLTTAVIRTAVNTTVLSAVVAAVFKLTGWQVEVDDLLPFVPAMLPIAAVFYRASRAIGDRYPAIGYILFGIPRPPVYPVEPMPPPALEGP